MIEDFIALLAQFLAVAVVLTFHEFAHAYAAYKCGDPTAKLSGRMTLNPAKHFDVLGLVMFTVAGFGWAKPVPVNPNNFDNYRKGSFWTSAAGIFMNYAMAFVFYPLFYIVLYYLYPIFAGKYMGYFIYVLFLSLYTYSLSFCVFNLLPFYPLDGFRIVDALNKKHGAVYRFLRNYGYYVLVGLIFVHILAQRIYFLAYFDILGYVLSFAMNILGKPITLFWDWILGFILK